MSNQLASANRQPANRQPEHTALWRKALEQARPLANSPASFEQWFSSVQFDGLELIPVDAGSPSAGIASATLTLRVRNEFVRDWVRDNYQSLLLQELSALCGIRVNMHWLVSNDLHTPVFEPPVQAFDSPAQTQPPRARRLPLDARAHRDPRASAPPPASALPASPPPYGTYPPSANPAAVSHQAPPAAFAHGSVPPAAFSPGSVPPPSNRRSSIPPSHAAGFVQSAVAPAATRPSYLAGRTQRSQLNQKYTFQNFVVGPSNELANAAAVGSSGGGGPRYNPLFICGGTGLGKTHLMHSIAHQVLELKPDACVLYVSAERFTNQFIEALQHHKMEEFRRRYRSECDLLLLDDIQFLAGREQTQEEFFHTFNALHEADKPIIVSSDKYPQDLQRMPERLISRFTSGLVADIQTPALETRVAIVRKKAQLEGIVLSDEVAVLLGQNVKSNVRELEGTLIRLAAKSSLLGRVIDLEFARSELAIIAPTRPEIRSIADIQRIVSSHFRVTTTELLSKDRHKSVAFARQVAMYLCRQRLKCSYPELGRSFGSRDHTTAMNAIRRINQLKEKDPQVNAHLDALEQELSRSDYQ